MISLKSLCRRIPLIYPLWHSIRVKNNERKERSKKHSFDKYGMEVLDDIYKVINKYDYKVICAFGTLLGIIRDDRLLPWDDDHDFLILDDGSFSWKEFDSAMIEGGFKLYREFEEEGKVVEKSYRKKGVLCDIRIWEDYQMDHVIHEDYFELPEVEYINGKYCEYETILKSYKAIKEVKTYSFKGVNVKIPENCDEFFEAAYGPGWKTPDPDWKPKEERIRIMRKATYFR